MKKVLSETEQKQRNGKIVKYGLIVFLLALIVYGLIDTWHHSMDYISAHKPKLFGTILEVEEDRILIAVHSFSEIDERYWDQAVWVNRHTELPQSDDEFFVGSALSGRYNGRVTRNEANEPWIDKVYLLWDEGDAEDYYARLSSYELYQSQEK